MPEAAQMPEFVNDQRADVPHRSDRLRKTDHHRRPADPCSTPTRVAARRLNARLDQRLIVRIEHAIRRRVDQLPEIVRPEPRLVRDPIAPPHDDAFRVPPWVASAICSLSRFGSARIFGSTSSVIPNEFATPFESRQTRRHFAHDRPLSAGGSNPPFGEIPHIV
jgi:hypothetical protein